MQWKKKRMAARTQPSAGGLLDFPMDDNLIMFFHELCLIQITIQNWSSEVE